VEESKRSEVVGGKQNVTFAWDYEQIRIAGCG
jgi:hypothetical protein